MRINNFHKRVLEVSFDESVKRIEVEKIVPPTEEDADDETYWRRIRLTTSSGEVFEISCDSYREEDLEVVEVDKLGPVQQPKPDNRDWLRPKASKGKARASRK
jgi:hypothetical protein